MARVLAISSQVIWGPVGNSAAVPALQHFGHEVMQVPTVLLSNHPGHGQPQGRTTDAQLLEGMLRRASECGAFANLDAVMTGYFASPEQVAAAARLIAETKPAHVLVDPVIGDHGRIYVAESVARAIRDVLLPLATITTPNVFELAWLTGSTCSNLEQILAATSRLGVAETIVTSAPAAQGRIATVLFAGEAMEPHESNLLQALPNGTGDVFAGLYLGARLGHDAPQAFTQAMALLDAIAAKSASSTTLAIEHLATMA